MRIVGAVGMPGSGKGEVAKVAENLGYKVVRFRDVVEREVPKRGYTGPLALTLTAHEARIEQGEDYFARQIVDEIKGLQAERVFVEGIRTPTEIRVLREAFPGFYCIGVTASLETRVERALKRGRKDDPRTLQELKKKDEIEASWGVAEAVRAADTVVENNSDLATLRLKVKRVLEGLK